MHGLEQKLAHCLLWLRLSVFLVMFMWTVDKLIRPDHAAGVFEKFYFLGGLDQILVSSLGIGELILLVAFLLGIQKTFTYGAVLLFHTVSTLSSYNQYFAPFEGGNLLFFAAWPMLAACHCLFRFREQDHLFTFSTLFKKNQ